MIIGTALTVTFRILVPFKLFRLNSVYKLVSKIDRRLKSLGIGEEPLNIQSSVLGVIIIVISRVLVSNQEN